MSDPELVEGESNGGHGRNRTGDKGFADLCLTTWLRGHKDAFNLADLSAFFKSLETVLSEIMTVFFVYFTA